uniref:GDP-fucose protein O-fucosyltransferase 1 n=1 Tax=Timspurckia oligopyrenoides TaxID=708627 RepID=A0A7S0ZL36_9RHOD|mmetsp:Transcript_8706/g.15725  ORF Transcript_8706/g.15725 Transcript_8706/m.15725 type:complete len:451 (+) Transcript_8706:60-1412(+)
MRISLIVRLILFVFTIPASFVFWQLFFGSKIDWKFRYGIQSSTRNDTIFDRKRRVGTELEITSDQGSRPKVNLHDLRPFQGDIPSPKWLNAYVEFHRNAQRLNSEGKDVEVKYLLWFCYDICGGLGDRMRGVVTMLYLAIATDRVLLLQQKNPVALNVSLIPAKINWDFEQWNLPEHIRENWQVLSAIDSSYETLQFYTSGAYEPERYLSIASNYPGWNAIVKDPKWTHKFPGIDELAKESGGMHVDFLFPIGTKTLFHFSSRLETYIVGLRKYLKFLEQEYIGIHWRAGGVWADQTRHDLKYIDKVPECVKQMNLAISNNRGTKCPPIYICSDQSRAKSLLLNKLKLLCGNESAVYASPFIPFHIDRSDAGTQSVAIQKALQTWADYYLLHQSSCVMVSRSGFSEIAALSSTNPFNGSRCWTTFDDCTADGILTHILNPSKEGSVAAKL